MLKNLSGRLVHESNGSVQSHSAAAELYGPQFALKFWRGRSRRLRLCIRRLGLGPSLAPKQATAIFQEVGSNPIRGIAENLAGSGPALMPIDGGGNVPSTVLLISKTPPRMGYTQRTATLKRTNRR